MITLLSIHLIMFVFWVNCVLFDLLKVLVGMGTWWSHFGGWEWELVSYFCLWLLVFVLQCCSFFFLGSVEYLWKVGMVVALWNISCWFFFFYVDDLSSKCTSICGEWTIGLGDIFCKSWVFVKLVLCSLNSDACDECEFLATLISCESSPGNFKCYG